MKHEIIRSNGRRAKWEEKEEEIEEDKNYSNAMKLEIDTERRR